MLMNPPLGHLLNNKETLLDDLNRFGVADKFLILLDDSLFRDGSNKVVDTEKVVETRERGESSPIIEGANTTKATRSCHVVSESERLGALQVTNLG